MIDLTGFADKVNHRKLEPVIKLELPYDKFKVLFLLSQYMHNHLNKFTVARIKINLKVKSCEK